MKILLCVIGKEVKKKIKKTLKREDRLGVVTQLVECSPSTPEALGLIQNCINIAHV